MDDLTAYKVADIRRLIEAAGAQLLCLPAYSPDSDPIENAFAKRKALLRTAAARPYGPPSATLKSASNPTGAETPSQPPAMAHATQAGQQYP